jgi:heme O synthase-like polyprenyltransferase
MQRFQDVRELTKAVLSVYNATVCTVVYCAAAPVPALLAGSSVFVGSFFMACSSQTLNQVIEAEYDKMMRRTWSRPIPKDRISK